MSGPKTITVIGGGLAGLALGIGLRHQGIPVVIREAGHYPRHRVCGEFINGRGLDVLAKLDLRSLFFKAGAITAETAAFFTPRAQSPVRPLPVRALCLSRHLMDELLAQEFRRLGGELRENDRCRDNELGEGCVRASGRRPAPTESRWRWFGLKTHARNVPLQADLELHITPSGYVGLCRLNGGIVNVCGLFRRRAGGAEEAGAGLEWLRGPADSLLRQQLAGAELDPPSVCSVGGCTTDLLIFIKLLWIFALVVASVLATMKTQSLTPAEILAQMAQIQSMEQGKLSSYRRAGRSKDADTYYRLQTWQKGKNFTRHVRPEELPALEVALEGYARYCQLSQQYVQLIVDRTRIQREQSIKKKIQPYSRHFRKKSSGSSSHC